MASVRSAARSDPASGSEKPWHHMPSPALMRGRCLAFCSSVPYRRITGPTQLTAMYCWPRGSPWFHISSPTMACRQGVAPRPPYSTGQCWVSHPFSAILAQNVRENAACSSLPGPPFEISSQSSGSSSRMNWRSSSRKATSSGLQSNSMGPLLVPARARGFRAVSLRYREADGTVCPTERA